MDLATDKRRARRELAVFLALAFAITWGLALVLLLIRPWLVATGALKGPLNQSWIYYLAVYAPTLSAVVLSLAFGGWNGLARLFGGLVRPAKLIWIGLAVFTYPAALLIVGLAEHLTGIAAGAPPIDLHALLVTAPVLLVTTPEIFSDPGPFGEEAGWRGFALPRLLQQVEPLWAAILLGLIWMVWHIPAFLAAGLAQSGLDFGWFMATGVALSVFMTWLYVNANGNFLIAGIAPHMIFNLGFAARVTRDQPTEAIVLILIAGTLIAAFGLRLSRRRAALTAR